jgi:hypothetical protein
MVLGTQLGWSNFRTVAVSIALAFVFGYMLTMRPLLGSGLPFVAAARLAAAADTLSIAVMEIVDNAIMLLVPGAMDAPPSSWRLWISLAFALIVAGLAAYPVNRWLIRRGRGHAVVHAHHHESGSPGAATHKTSGHDLWPRG